MHHYGVYDWLLYLDLPNCIRTGSGTSGSYPFPLQLPNSRGFFGIFGRANFGDNGG